MKKLKYLFIAALALFSFNACEDVPEPYKIPGTGGSTGGSGSTQEGVLVNESFKTDFGIFTPVQTEGNYPWVIDYSTAKATSYVDDKNYAAQSWLIASPIDLTNETETYISFEYIIRYAASGKVATNHQLLISDNYNGNPANATWINLPYNAVEGSDWNTFYKANVSVPEQFIGKNNIVVALKYTAEEKAGTWEVKNFVISNTATNEEEEEEPTEVITVAQAIDAYTGTPKSAIVKGYIVGWVEGMNYSEGARFNGNVTEEKGNTDIILADSPDETDASKCIPVQLPSGDVRNKVNLQENPGNYKKLVTLTGSIEKYFGVPGLKSVTKALFEGESDDNTGEGDNEGEDTPPAVVEGTIAAIHAAKDDVVEATANGTILATYARGFLVGDDTGSILVYLGEDKGHKEGDVVTVNGTTSVYGGLKQFGTTSTVEKTGTAIVTQPTATKMTGADLDAYINKPTIKYVEYTGTLNISGYYYNITIDGASTAVGSIGYPKEGLVDADLNGKEVKVTGYLVGVSGTKYITTMATSVVAADGDDNTGDDNTGGTAPAGSIADILASPAGDATASGTIVATYARGFLVNDGTGSILVYLGSNEYKAGDVITVSGTTSVYAGIMQFGNTSTVEKTGTATVTLPTATQMTGADLDAYLNSPETKYVQYTGTLEKSGNYYNVNIDGASTAVGSISYPEDGVVDESLNGKKIIVTGFAIGVSGTKFVNTMVTSVVAADGDAGDDSGEQDKEEETPSTGNGITVAQLIEKYNAGDTGAAVVTAYIVGTSEAGKSKFTPILGIDNASNTNIIIADNPNETDTSKCIPVQLPSGAVRNGLNLANNPGNLGKKVTLTGEIQKYFSMAGLKSVTEYTIE